MDAVRERHCVLRQARRQVAVQEACTREAQRYSEKRAGIQIQTAAAAAEIEAAKADLAAAQIVRQHEEEYEVGACPLQFPLRTVCYPDLLCML